MASNMLEIFSKIKWLSEEKNCNKKEIALKHLKSAMLLKEYSHFFYSNFSSENKEIHASNYSPKILPLANNFKTLIFV
jgi:hypothetical protein